MEKSRWVSRNFGVISLRAQWRVRFEIGHTYQRALREWYIEQRSAGRKCRPQADFLYEKKRGDGPEFIEREDEGEHLPEFFAQAPVIKAGSRDEITAQGDTDAGGDHYCCGQHGCGPCREKRVRNVLNRMQVKKCGEIEAEIHELNQDKEAASYATIRDGNFEIGVQHDCRGGG